MKNRFLSTLPQMFCPLWLILFLGTVIPHATTDVRTVDHHLLQYNNIFNYLNKLLIPSAQSSSTILKNACALDQEERINRIVTSIMNPTSDLDHHLKERLEVFTQQLVSFIEKKLMYGELNTSVYERELSISLSVAQLSDLQKLCVSYVDELTTLYKEAQDPYHLFLQDCLCFFKTLVEESNKLIRIKTEARSLKKRIRTYAAPFVAICMMVGSSLFAGSYYLKRIKLEIQHDNAFTQAEAITYNVNCLERKGNLPRAYQKAFATIKQKSPLLVCTKHEEERFCNACLNERVRHLADYNQRLELCKKLYEAQPLILNSKKNTQTLYNRYQEYKNRGIGASFIARMDQFMSTYPFRAHDTALEDFQNLLKDPSKVCASCSPQELAANIKIYERGYPFITTNNQPEEGEALLRKKFFSLYNEAQNYVGNLEKTITFLKKIRALQCRESDKRTVVEALKGKLLPFADRFKHLKDLDNYADRDNLINDCLKLESMTLSQEHADLWNKVQSSIPSASLEQFKSLVHTKNFKKDDLENIITAQCYICYDDEDDITCYTATHSSNNALCTVIICTTCFKHPDLLQKPNQNERPTCPNCRWPIPRDILKRLDQPRHADGFNPPAPLQEIRRKQFCALYEKTNAEKESVS